MQHQGQIFSLPQVLANSKDSTLGAPHLPFLSEAQVADSESNWVVLEECQVHLETTHFCRCLESWAELLPWPTAGKTLGWGITNDPLERPQPAPEGESCLNSQFRKNPEKFPKPSASSHWPSGQAITSFYLSLFLLHVTATFGWIRACIFSTCYYENFQTFRKVGRIVLHKKTHLVSTIAIILPRVPYISIYREIFWLSHLKISFDMTCHA